MFPRERFSANLAWVTYVYVALRYSPVCDVCDDAKAVQAAFESKGEVALRVVHLNDSTVWQHKSVALDSITGKS